MNVYSIAGAQLSLGADFTTTTQRIDTPAESAAHGSAPIGSFVAVEIQHRFADLDALTDDQLARWGIVRTVEADPPPPVVRAELPKSTVVERLEAIGKLDQVFAVMLQSAKFFGLWTAPNWPNVYCDDADVLAALAAAGLTSDEIATVMAPLA